VNIDKPIKEPNKSRDKFELFLARHLKRHVRFVQEGKKGFSRLVRRGNILFCSLWKYRSFVLAFVLLSTLTTTFGSSPSFRDPTYSEAQQFVNADNTDRNPYIIGSYTCVNFAADFRSNALRSGYECGIVFLYFPDNTRHAINGFNTTDKGLVFVEPQSDIFVNVTVGKRYQTERITSSFKNDTVMGYYVDW
jgi:hypothetical protein